MFEKFEKFYNEIKNKLDLYEIGQKFSEFFIREFNAEACEIKYLEENEVFSRIHFALKLENNIIHDQDLIEKRFGVKKTPAKQSLIGHCIKTGMNYIWIEKNTQFGRWVHSKKEEPVNIDSALRYLKEMPSKTIKNFVVLPLITPEDRRISESYAAKVCLHIFNLSYGSTDGALIDRILSEISKIFNYISVIIFNAIFYNRARDEIHINKRIDEITTKSENMENVLKGVVEEFTKRLKSPLTTIWFPDHELRLLALHSFYIKTEYSKVSLDMESIRKIIKTEAPQILKADDCLIGDFFNNPKLPWIKENNIGSRSEGKYKWGGGKFKNKG